MEIAYTVVGGDGSQYGPVSIDQLRNWVRDGRVVADSPVWRSDAPDWVTAAALPELAVATPAFTSSTPTTDEARERDPALQKRVRMGASWFYWIAALTLFNSVSALCHWEIGFYLGLGITQWIDGLLGQAGTTGTVIALSLDLAATALLVFFGVFSNKYHTWAFIVGMILLGLDTLIVVVGALLLPSEWISVAFHVWALCSIFGALKASRAMK